MRTSRSSLTLIATLLLAAAAALVVACSGGSTTSLDDLSDEEIAAAQRTVDAAVLTIDDLPPGWTLDPDQSDDDDLEYFFSGDCKVLNDYVDVLPGQIAEAESADFNGRPGHSFTSDATAFYSEDAAKEAVETYRSLRISCSDQIAGQIAASLRVVFTDYGATEQELATISVLVHDLPFPQLSDDADAYQVAWQANIGGTAYDVKLHFPYWRHGNIVAGLSYSTSQGEPDMRIETLVADLINDKLIETRNLVAESD